MHRLPPLPAAPRPPARTPFPLIAVVAPLVGAVIIGLVTGSPFVLIFAVLSPIIAIATVLDGRRHARRALRDEAARFERECEQYELAITRAHADERAAFDERHPRDSGIEVGEHRAMRIGTAPSASTTAPDAPPPCDDPQIDERLRGMLERARRHPALPVVVPRGPVLLQGEGIVAESLARRLQLECDVAVERGEPQAPRSAMATVVRVLSATRVLLHVPGREPVEVRPELASLRQLEQYVSARSAAATPPDSVRWGELDREGEVVDGVPIGVGGHGIVGLDLERSGPHALVGGTTGSGKSEFLRTLALGWAARHPPSALQLLLVDFKGGATFAELARLPHVIGLVTDLDPLVAQRTLLSVKAELRRRERVLVEAGVRDVADRPGLLARLVVLVDEFAALMDAFPELHAPFADLSARGRSLGVHLVLGTQHPAGVVRDAVAANCAVRIAFRLSTAAASAFIGRDAAEIAAAPPGRALVVDAAGARALQVAVVDEADIAAVAARWGSGSAIVSPWLPPLPTRIDHDQLASLAHDDGELPCSSDTVDGPDSLPPLAFGVLDDPAELRRLPALYLPTRDGALAIAGASRSGRTTTLLALQHAAQRAGASTVVVPTLVADAWQLLERLAERPPAATLLLADDLDLLVAEAAELGADLLQRWDSAVRGLRRAGGGAAAAVGPVSAARSVLGARFESRVLLRAADAEDHQLAGAPRGLFDRAAPPGRGWWHDLQVQVLDEGGVPLAPEPVTVAPWNPSPGGDALVITRRAAAVAAAVAAAHPDHRVVRDLTELRDHRELRDLVDPARGDRAVAIDRPAGRVFVADPDAWHAAWPALSEAKRATQIVIAHADAADVRALLGLRASLPPLVLERGEVWVVAPGEGVERRRWSPLAAG
ncbi:FtsK/SpoIIIE domain-containing protein [Microcella sp.]|uniref:FtsK/SpoIIIE domain-containing protein n=1 Tax=Microcella sp. TaxID=1913979 RepID=UPI00391B6AED